jgi:Family of unknown function (DUF6600)/FecR protein
MSSLKIGVRVTLTVLAASLLSLPSFADSQVRIVRLSDVRGDVQIDRNAGQGFEKAFLNLPVVQGAKLRAGHDGLAAVEFEDGSTVRITPETVITFPQLTLRDSGAKASTVTVLQGTAYVSFVGSRDNELTLAFGSEAVTLTGAAHLRLEMGHARATLAVLKGDIQVNGPSGIVEVGKKRSVTFDLADRDQYILAKKVEEGPYDAWDQRQDEYDSRYAKHTAFNNSPYAYGMSDLNYYGNFFNVPGYGLMWQPYFIGAGWDPFMDGGWAWYPGFGYAWVSSYPWGWMPYHYGSWTFLPSYGWAWQPGGSWTGLNNVPNTMNPPRTFNPPRPPATPVRSFVMVNRRPLVAPTVSSAGRVMIRNGSAGFGIPRGSLDNLRSLSRNAQRHGVATTMVGTPPSATSLNSPAAARAGYSRPAPMPRGGAPNFPGASPRGSAPSAAPSFQGGMPAPAPRGASPGAASPRR